MKKLLLAVILLLPFYVQSQQIEGVVYGIENNKKTTLPGVNIYWQNTTDGVASKSDGTFAINKNKKSHVLVLSFVGYKTKTMHIHSEENDDQHPLEIILIPDSEIDEVTIVTKDKGTYVSQIDPIHSEKIGGSELHKAACCNLAESFETNPSVDVSYSDAVSGAKQIRLLGLDGIYSTLQLENLPIYRGIATNFGLTYIPGPWMQSIQVSKGAASVVNGYDAIAGQINVEYKKPDDIEKVFLNTFASTHGRYEVNANGNFRLKNKNLTTGIFIHASDLSKENDENNDGFLDTPLSTQYQFLNRWKYKNDHGFMMQAGISALDEKRVGGQVGYKKELRNSIYGIDLDNERYDFFFKSGFDMTDYNMAVALLSNYSNHSSDMYYGLTNFKATENRFYLNLIISNFLDDHGVHTFNSGFSYLVDDVDQTIYNRDMNTKEEVPGVFTEYTYKPNHHLTFLAGFRADFHSEFGTFYTPRMHVKYKPTEKLLLRLSAGKGFRTANVIADNTFLLANGRELQWEEDMMQEEAWNFGAAVVQTYSLLDRDLQINTEFFYTDFETQLVIDKESSATNILLSPLQGDSYAAVFQADIRWQPIERLDMLIAYKLNNVKQTIENKLDTKPLVNDYKGLLNLNYTTIGKSWMFDYTLQLNGGGRLPNRPNALSNIIEKDSFDSFTIMNAQVTKYFKRWNIYVGVENLADYKQKNPIYNAKNPFSDTFDATTIWAPVAGRRIYAGLRLSLNYDD